MTVMWFIVSLAIGLTLKAYVGPFLFFIPFWVWLVAGFVIGWLLRGYLSRKLAFLQRIRDPFGRRKRREQQGGATPQSDDKKKSGLFSKAGEYLVSKPIEFLMGGKPSKKKKDEEKK